MPGILRDRGWTSRTPRASTSTPALCSGCSRSMAPATWCAASQSKSWVAQLRRPKHITLVEFPSKAWAKEFYASSEFRDIMEIRRRSAKTNLVLVEQPEQPQLHRPPRSRTRAAWVQRGAPGVGGRAECARAGVGAPCRSTIFRSASPLRPMRRHRSRARRPENSSPATSPTARAPRAGPRSTAPTRSRRLWIRSDPSGQYHATLGRAPRQRARPDESRRVSRRPVGRRDRAAARPDRNDPSAWLRSRCARSRMGPCGACGIGIRSERTAATPKLRKRDVDLPAVLVTRAPASAVGSTRASSRGRNTPWRRGLRHAGRAARSHCCGTHPSATTPEEQVRVLVEEFGYSPEIVALAAPGRAGPLSRYAERILAPRRRPGRYDDPFGAAASSPSIARCQYGISISA